jgi:iron complex outermembrane recepter protein
MIIRISAALLVGVGTTGLILSSVGFAAADTDSVQLEEIVVTAQKKTEDLQKASIAIDAVAAQQLADQGIRNAIDLQDIVPAVKFVAADEMTVLIRGLGTINDNPGVDSAVGYSEDGIYLSHPEALSPVLYDLQRVEAVLGPQGTLYGRNTNGGVINFITNNPTFDFGGHVQVGGGNYNALNSDAALNLPLNDQWALRVAGGSDYHGPYDSDGGNNVKSGGGRIKLLYEPNDDLKVLLKVDGASRRSNGQNYGALCPPGNVDAGCAGVAYVPYSGISAGAHSPYNDDAIFGASLDVEYNLGWSNLTWLTGYKQYHFEGDTSPAWYGGIDHFDYIHSESDRFITQEVRLANEPGSKISWVGGVYYSNEIQPATVLFEYHDTILQGLGLPPNYFERLDTLGSRYQSEAAFGDVTIPLFVDNFRFRGGLRYTHETKDATGTVESGAEGLPAGTFGPTEVNPADESISKVTWKAGLDYDLTPRNLLYFTASTGFKSGGVNNLPAVSGITTYAPETITAYQAGSKNRFLEDRVQVNLELFRYFYNGYQAYLFYSPTGGPLAGSTLFPTVNSQTATFEGGELNAAWQMTKADRFGFDLNVLHNLYGTFVVALPYTSVFNLSGTEVPLSPKATYALSYQHSFTMPNGDALTFAGYSQIVMSHVVDGNYNGDVTYTQATYHKTDLSANYHTARSGWTFTLFVRNVENAAVINSISGGYPVLPDLNYTNVMLDPPRTYGGSIRKDF